jgi:hypothetical protein
MKNVHSISHLSIASWNVQGLGSKLNDASFVRELRKHHIIALLETHCTSDTQIALDGYLGHHVYRPKSGSKAHGGISIFVKKELRPGIKFYSAKSTDLLWICLKKEFFKTTSEIFIGAVYISPLNSTYSKKLEYDPLDIIEQEIGKYAEQGNVILMGDFNDRTGTFQDYVSDNGTRYIPVPDSVVFDPNFRCRQSQDSSNIHCKYGKQLIEMCVATGLKIVNGRVFGDPCGKFTCHHYNGSSVVDYVLADNTTLPQLRYFKVEDLIGDI